MPAQLTHSPDALARNVRARVSWLLGTRAEGECPKALAPQRQCALYASSHR